MQIFPLCPGSQCQGHSPGRLESGGTSPYRANAIATNHKNEIYAKIGNTEIRDTNSIRTWDRSAHQKNVNHSHRGHDQAIAMCPCWTLWPWGHRAPTPPALGAPPGAWGHPPPNAIVYDYDTYDNNNKSPKTAVANSRIQRVWAQGSDPAQAPSNGKDKLSAHNGSYRTFWKIRIIRLKSNVAWQRPVTSFPKLYEELGLGC